MCLQCLGLDPVRGQEVTDKLKEYLRAPGNSVSISRQDIYSNRAKQTISQLAHNLLCDQLWGQTYFNQPHVGCGYSNVRFDADSTWYVPLSLSFFPSFHMDRSFHHDSLEFEALLSQNHTCLPGPGPWKVANSLAGSFSSSADCSTRSSRPRSGGESPD